MADALALVVLVATGSAASTTPALVQAAQEALGPDTRVEVRETPAPPTDADALATEGAEHADAVVELVWGQPGSREATVRIHIARTGHWIDRTIAFELSDAEPERGRTLGFAVASMLPESFPHRRERAIAPASSPGPTHPFRTSAASFDLLAIGSTGVGGDASGLGGEVGAQWFPIELVSLRLGAGVRGGSIDAVQGRTLTLLVSAGAVVSPWRVTPARPFGMAMRADFLIISQSVTRVTSGFESPSRVLPGVDLVVDASWMFAPGVEGIVGLGGEEAFGPTSLALKNSMQNVATITEVANIPEFRVVGEAGLRVGF
jgi:hypothetical protein